MATYTKETALYDTNAIADDISAAGETASKFLSADSSGIMIYDGTNGAQAPSNPASTTRNVFIDDDSVDVRLGNDTLATFGELTMIGKEERSRLIFETNQMYGITDKNVESFRISGNGVTESLPTTRIYQGTFDDTNYQALDVLKNAQLSSGKNFTVLYSKLDTSTDTFVLLASITYKYGTSSAERYYTSNSRKYYIKYDGNKTISVKKDLIEAGAGANRFEIKCIVTVEIGSPYYTFGTRADSSVLGAYSFSMGQNNTASGKSSCVEGWGSTASGLAAHAEGSTTASGQFTHSEGGAAKATYDYSHAEGYGSTASGTASHAQNYYTIAQGAAQTAIGKYNVANGGQSSYTSDGHAFIIGNGTSNSARSNALTVDWSGNVNIASGAKYKINGTALAASDVGAVPTTRKVNNKALSADITLSAADVSAVPTTRKVNNKALSADITLTAADVSAVPTTRKVNNKALSADITLSASDVSAVPTTRKVNNKALSADITLSASDVSAVPTTRTVNSKALDDDISLDAADVGAVSDVQLNGTSLKSGTVANLLTSNLVNLLYPVGSCYITSTNTNPKAQLGGEWSLIHKSYKSQWISTGFTWNTTNTSDQSFDALLHGTTIEFRFVWKNKVAISDTTQVIGTLTPASVGINGGEHGGYPVGSSDALNAAIVCFFDLASTGTQQLQVLDWVTRTASYPTGTGNWCYLTYTMNARYYFMLDSFCDEFVWKRTS